jgi:hypothetical protein
MSIAGFTWCDFSQAQLLSRLLVNTMCGGVLWYPSFYVSASKRQRIFVLHGKADMHPPPPPIPAPNS